MIKTRRKNCLILKKTRKPQERKQRGKNKMQRWKSWKSLPLRFPEENN